MAHAVEAEHAAAELIIALRSAAVLADEVDGAPIRHCFEFGPSTGRNRAATGRRRRTWRPILA
jgi:hypothetical protein